MNECLYNSKHKYIAVVYCLCRLTHDGSDESFLEVFFILDINTRVGADERIGEDDEMKEKTNGGDQEVTPIILN